MRQPARLPPRGACACNHIARVLFVPRRVGDDEFPFRRGKIAVCHIDRNALFAFGFQSVGQDGEVYGFFQTFAFAGFQVLIWSDSRACCRRAVVRSGAFAVIDAACCSEAERGIVLCRHIFFLICLKGF